MLVDTITITIWSKCLKMLCDLRTPCKVSVTILWSTFGEFKKLFCFPLVSVHWVSDFHMPVPVSLHFNIVAVGQLLILVYHFQYPCFFSVCVSHLCTLPSPHLLKAGEVSLLQARLFICISSSVSAPLPLLYLQTCLLSLWTWFFLPRNYAVAFQRMDCSEGAFLSLTAVHIHPNVSVLIRCQ